MTPFTLLLALIWIGLTAEASPANAALGLLVAWLVTRWLPCPAPRWTSLRKLPRLVALLLFVLKEMLVANLRVAACVLDERRVRPCVVAVPLRLTDPAAIALLAHLVTLTPGTLSLDVSPDGRTLWVHDILDGDPEHVRCSIRDGFERRLLELFA
ncbi:MAG: Na+/H+ antiporter subunit E [Planctomycetes bacterium]|nr:Na+/H+ antiporter subunit E [Planctomycetota bacterium]